MAEHVRGSRAVALSAARTLIPTSRLGVWGLAQGARLISALPAGPSRAAHCGRSGAFIRRSRDGG